MSYSMLNSSCISFTFGKRDFNRDVMHRIIFLILLAMLASSCKNSVILGNKEQETDTIASGSDTTLSKAYYEDGALKSVSQMKNGLRNGLTKNFYRNGALLSEVYYANGLRNGVAVNYYKEGGVHARIPYRNDVKEGEAVWYYPSGKPYRITPYHQNLIDGIQRFFYESGQIQAEVPWKKGQPGTGLKEYTESGRLIREPSVVVRPERLNDAVILYISLSDESRNVTFYQGELTEGRYLNRNLRQLKTTGGKSIIQFRPSDPETTPKEFHIVAIKETSLRNQQILYRKYRYHYPPGNE
jgi:antitoxin component YwqK of YwqJK toxin-antitoxin module